MFGISRPRNLFRILILFTIAGTSVRAQLTTGTVTGNVSDSSAAPVASAEVTLINNGTSVTYKTSTDGSGNFRFLLLPVGTYTIEASSKGFKTFRREGIIVETDRSLAVPVTLEIGTVNETVEVTAGTPLLDPNTSSLGTVMDQKKVQDLPLNGRNPMGLANLIPTVRGIGLFGGLVTSTWSTAAVTIGGGSVIGSGYLVDGIANDKMIDTGESTVLPVEATEEFKVLTNNMSAEFGRTGGGIISVISKSGTNQFHGSLFEYLRNSVLDADEFFANKNGTPRLPLVFNQFGGSLAGPIKKDKLFFFVNYEGVRERQTLDTTLTSPTPLQRTGDFSQTFTSTGALIKIYDPTTSALVNPNVPGVYVRTQFLGNSIPKSSINPVAAAIMNYYPLPNQPGLPFSQAQNLFLTGHEPLNNDTVTGKVDYDLSPSRRLSGRYTQDNLSFDLPNYFGNAAAADGRTVPIPHHSAFISFTNVFTPTLLLDAKVGFNRENEHYFAPAQGFDITSLGFPASLMQQAQKGYGKGPGFPSISITDASAFGRPDNLGNPSSTSSASVAMTRSRASHSLKFGYEYRLYRRNDYGTASPYGAYTFTRGFTQGPNPLQPSTTAGFGVASFLLGDPSSGTANYTTDNTKSFDYHAAFVQDDWKTTRKLTLNLGMRWAYEGAVHDRYNVLSNFDPLIPSPLTVPGLPLRGGLFFPGVNGVPSGIIDPSKKDFAPRFGLAYQATRNIVIRGGYGIMYIPTVGTSYTSTGFTATTSMITSIDGVTPYNNLSNPFPSGINRPTGSSLGAATGIGGPISGQLRDTHVGHAEEWNFTLQIQPKPNWLVEAAWVGNHGVHLMMYGVPLDILSPANFALGTQLQQSVKNPFANYISAGPLSTPTITLAQLLLPYPQFTSVNGGYAFRGSSTYNAFTLKVEKRFSHGFSILGAYTFSKLLDLGDNTTQLRPGEAIGTAVQNWNDVAAEKSLSLINVPQRLVMTALWAIPTGGLRNPFLRHTLGNWQVNVISTSQTGQPIALAASVPGGGNRPNVVPGVSEASPNKSLNEWFNIQAFSIPLSYTFGNVSRTLPHVLGPGLCNVDLSVIRSFPIVENYKLQFRAEAFNLNNTPYFTNPGGTIGSNTFGVITSTSNQPRILQFALRVDF